ncbi:hypothetical protein [Micromonospora sp. WMMD710]|uniref:hypothetical protein n=1 Tax=Micromonospora sp. WMMD710 TaxID=3016085 RepID=UPI00241797EF|nr:hypothetical protein [Micromonospora sp. WMMD710]MDG4758961.1 hypothetical protein [Micromonospora sp. WMMD710]
MLPVAFTCPLWWVARWATRVLTSLAVVAALTLGASAGASAGASPGPGHLAPAGAGSALTAGPLTPPATAPSAFTAGHLVPSAFTAGPLAPSAFTAGSLAPSGRLASVGQAPSATAGDAADPRIAARSADPQPASLAARNVVVALGVTPVRVAGADRLPHTDGPTSRAPRAPPRR